MKICMILEGCYPYVTGGVSSWAHQYIQAMPQHEFVLWLIGAHAADRGKFKYELPPNVVHVEEVFLDDALELRARANRKIHFAPEQIRAIEALINCGAPDWDVLFELYNTQHTNPAAFLMSEAFLDILRNICKRDYPYIAFADMFYTVRSMLLPVLYLLTGSVPEADVYHAICTGYGGLLGALGAWKHRRPLLLTEHGIYSREREEELIRAKWVTPAFKPYWTRFFYMLSNLAYGRAVMVSSLFENARLTQISMGCTADKTIAIPNGVRYERFCTLPQKKPDGWVDIGAVVRFAPIKDIKTMLYAFYELKQRYPNVRLHILGGVDDDDYFEECRAIIRQLDIPDILLPGIVNVIEYLSKIDFVILTSISEGQPLSVLEGLAAGRPCVTTDVGCCRELLGGSGDDPFGTVGYCVPPMHKSALADAMERMCRIGPEARAEMGLRGRQRVERYYRHHSMIEKYLVFYKEALKRWQASDSN